MLICNMTKKPETIITLLAITVITGLATYALYKTSKAVSDLDDIELDFGGDPGLESMFNRKDNK